MEGPFLPAPLNDSNEVEDLLVEPKSDHVLGNCLRVQDFSCDFGYGIQTNGGEFLRSIPYAFIGGLVLICTLFLELPPSTFFCF